MNDTPLDDEFEIHAEELPAWTGSARAYSPDCGDPASDSDTLGDEGIPELLNEPVLEIPAEDDPEAFDDPRDAVTAEEPALEEESAPEPDELVATSISIEDEEGELDPRDSAPEFVASGEPGDYTVYLSRVPGGTRGFIKGVMREVGGLTESHAEALTTRAVIPVVRDVSEETAEEVARQLRERGLAPRVVKK